MMWKTDWKAERMVEKMPWKISRMEEMRFVRPSNMPAMVADCVCVEGLSFGRFFRYENCGSGGRCRWVNLFYRMELGQDRLLKVLVNKARFWKYRGEFCV